MFEVYSLKSTYHVLWCIFSNNGINFEYIPVKYLDIFNIYHFLVPQVLRMGKLQEKLQDNIIIKMKSILKPNLLWKYEPPSHLSANAIYNSWRNFQENIFFITRIKHQSFCLFLAWLEIIWLANEFLFSFDTLALTKNVEDLIMTPGKRNARCR